MYDVLYSYNKVNYSKDNKKILRKRNYIYKIMLYLSEKVLI